MPILDLEEFLDEAKITYESLPHLAALKTDNAAAPLEGSRAPLDRGREQAIGLLNRQFVEEVQSIIRLKRHADRARYPQFARALRAIAKEEQRHAQRLVNRIHALGGKVPKASVPAEEESVGWRSLTEDLEAERHCCAELSEELALPRGFDAETIELLEAILRDEKKHLKAITAMQMRSDPQAVG